MHIDGVQKISYAETRQDPVSVTRRADQVGGGPTHDTLTQDCVRQSQLHRPVLINATSSSRRGLTKAPDSIGPLLPLK